MASESHRRHLIRARSNGDYFLLSRSYARILGRDLALFLADVLNFAYMRTTEDEEWFACSSKDLKSSLGWDDHIQAKYFKKLVELRVVKIKRIGLPPRRLVWIDIVRMEDLVDESSRPVPDGIVMIVPDGSVMNTREASYEAKKRNNQSCLTDRIEALKEKENSSKMHGFFQAYQTNEPAKIDQQFADQLRRAIKKIGRVPRGQNKTWVREFRLLRTKDKIPAGQIQAMLDWYEEKGKRFGGWPTILNAKHFRNHIKGEWLTRLFQKDQITEVEVSSDAYQLGKTIGGTMGWPQGGKDELYQAVQITLSSFREFWKRARAYADAHHEERSNKVAALAVKLVGRKGFHAGCLPESSTSTTNWFRRVNNIVTWLGSQNKRIPPLTTFAWKGDVTDAEFVKYLKTWTTDTEDAWKSFLEEMQ